MMERKAPRVRYLVLLGLAVLGQLLLARVVGGESLDFARGGQVLWRGGEQFWKALGLVLLGVALVSAVLLSVSLIYGKSRESRAAQTRFVGDERGVLVLGAIGLAILLPLGIWLESVLRMGLDWLLYPWGLAAISVGIQAITRPRAVTRVPPAASPMASQPPTDGPFTV